jgi:hypothetical protein
MIFTYGVISRIMCIWPLCHVIYHSYDKGSWRQPLLSIVRCCNACVRNFITGLTSAMSLRVDISSTCKVGQKLESVSPSVDMLPPQIIIILATVSQWNHADLTSALGVSMTPCDKAKRTNVNWSFLASHKKTFEMNRTAHWVIPQIEFIRLKPQRLSFK